jgi:hypothetical protein
MRPTDQPRFQSTMASLAEVFGKQLSPQLTELYWEALKSLAIEEFQLGAKSWIKHGKHFPKPGELLDRFREMTAAAPKVAYTPSEQSWGMILVNHLFFGYLARRRMTENFRGDIRLEARRARCRDLAGFLDQSKAEDLKPSLDEIKRMFEDAMAREEDETRMPA